MEDPLSPSQLEEDNIPSFSDYEEPSPPRKSVPRRVVASIVNPGNRDHPQSAYHGSPAHTRASTAKPEKQVIAEFLVLFHDNWLIQAEEDTVDDADDGFYFTSYELHEFVIYRPPDVKSLETDSEEGDWRENEGRTKGQGEYELPSAVHVTHGVKTLRTVQRSLFLVFMYTVPIDCSI